MILINSLKHSTLYEGLPHVDPLWCYRPHPQSGPIPSSQLSPLAARLLRRPLADDFASRSCRGEVLGHPWVSWRGMTTLWGLNGMFHGLRTFIINIPQTQIYSLGDKYTSLGSFWGWWILGIGIGIYQQCDVVHVWYWSIRELKEKMHSLQPTKDGDATEIEGIYNQ